MIAPLKVSKLWFLMFDLHVRPRLFISCRCGFCFCDRIISGLSYSTTLFLLSLLWILEQFLKNLILVLSGEIFCM